jgi:hypothetical protein
LYDLVFVEPGPLPPHERTWRHPSELGPTRLDIEDSARPHVNLMALAGGTMAVLAVAAMVVAMTPRASDGPVALSATTTPITARAVTEPPSRTVTAAMPAPIEVQAPTAMLTSFLAFPHAVTSEPEFDVDGTDVADAAPAADEMVFLRTEAVTYRLSWGDVQRMSVRDGSVVFDDVGDLVARVSDGDLLSLVGG